MSDIQNGIGGSQPEMNYRPSRPLTLLLADPPLSSNLENTLAKLQAAHNATASAVQSIVEIVGSGSSQSQSPISAGSGTITLKDTTGLFTITGSPASLGGTISITGFAESAISIATSQLVGTISNTQLAHSTIGLTDSTGLFTVTGSPASLGGGLTLSAFASQTQHFALMAPSTANGAAAFRAIVATDIPTLNQATTSTAGGLSGTPSISITNLTVSGTTSFASASIAVAALATTGTWAFAGTLSGSITDTNNFGLGLSSYTAGIANSPGLFFFGSYESSATGPTYAQDYWSIYNSIGTGVNGTSTLTIGHAGTSGAAVVSMPAVTIAGTATVGTLAATTIDGAALSGTFTGDVTLSGTITVGSLRSSNNMTCEGVLFVGGTSASDILQIQYNPASISVQGVNASLMGIAEANVGWLLALDTSGNLGINGILYAVDCLAVGGSLQATGATPTGSLTGIAFGSTTGTTAVTTSGGVSLPTLGAGYLSVNIGGTVYAIPYFKI